MKLMLLINIGTADAKRFNLANTLEGEVVTASKADGEAMIARGWAVEWASEPLKADPPKTELRGVPKTSANA